MRLSSHDEMLSFGARVARGLRGGEMIELVGDVGAGKTTFTKGLARGLGVHDAVQSPTFTISREYDTDKGLKLVHYDFYRLDDAGIMADELAESIVDRRGVTVVEWAETVASVLPEDRVTLTISLVADDEQARDVSWAVSGDRSAQLMEGIA